MAHGLRPGAASLGGHELAAAVDAGTHCGSDSTLGAFRVAHFDKLAEPRGELRIRLSDPSEVDQLMDAESYKSSLS